MAPGMDETYHIPVMLQETLGFLITNPAGVYVDGTFGGGGHTGEILKRISGSGHVYGLDADPAAIARGNEWYATELGKTLTLRHTYFSAGAETLLNEGVQLSGVLLDLGVSSRQLDSDQIGLSYRQTMPLDMRFDTSANRETAADLVNEWTPEDLATMFRKYGEEPAAWTIAQAIVAARRGATLRTTTDLREAIEAVIPGKFLIKTLSRVFQALRIAVNDELGELERGLGTYVELLNPGGRIVILTYHSLEDRIVKERFRDEAKGCSCPPEFPVCRCDKVQRLQVLTRKPALPGKEEIERNPRARSAKLRVAERIVDTKPVRSR